MGLNDRAVFTAGVAVASALAVVIGVFGTMTKRALDWRTEFTAAGAMPKTSAGPRYLSIRRLAADPRATEAQRRRAENEAVAALADALGGSDLQITIDRRDPVPTGEKARVFRARQARSLVRVTHAAPEIRAAIEDVTVAGQLLKKAADGAFEGEVSLPDGGAPAAVAIGAGAYRGTPMALITSIDKGPPALRLLIGGKPAPNGDTVTVEIDRSIALEISDDTGIHVENYEWRVASRTDAGHSRSHKKTIDPTASTPPESRTHLFPLPTEGLAANDVGTLEASVTDQADYVLRKKWTIRFAQPTPPKFTFCAISGKDIAAGDPARIVREDTKIEISGQLAADTDKPLFCSVNGMKPFDLVRNGLSVSGSLVLEAAEKTTESTIEIATTILGKKVTLARATVVVDRDAPKWTLSRMTGTPEPLTSPVATAAGADFRIRVEDAGDLMLGDVTWRTEGGIVLGEVETFAGAFERRLVVNGPGKLSLGARDGLGHASAAAFEFTLAGPKDDGEAPKIAVATVSGIPVPPDETVLVRSGIEFGILVFDPAGLATDSPKLSIELDKSERNDAGTQATGRFTPAGDFSIEAKDMFGHARRVSYKIVVLPESIALLDASGKPIADDAPYAIDTLPVTLRIGTEDALPPGTLDAAIGPEGGDAAAAAIEGRSITLDERLVPKEGRYVLAIGAHTIDGHTTLAEKTLVFAKKAVTPVNPPAETVTTKPAEAPPVGEPEKAAEAALVPAPATADAKPADATKKTRAMPLAAETANTRDGGTLRLIDLESKSKGRSFYIYDTEITLGMFRKFWAAVKDDASFLADPALGLANEKSRREVFLAMQKIAANDDEDEKMPVRTIDETMTRAYMNWAKGGITLTGRLLLPTDEQWKFAAGRLDYPEAVYPVLGNDGQSAPPGSTGTRGAQWHGARGPQKVKTFEAGAFGLYDFAGNVSELVRDSSRKGRLRVAGGDFRSTTDQEMRIDTMPEFNVKIDPTRIGFRPVFEIDD